MQICIIRKMLNDTLQIFAPRRFRLLEFRSNSYDLRRRFGLACVSHLEEVPLLLDSVSPHYALFLAFDAMSASDALIRGVSKMLLEKGAIYLCAWGPDCKRVHDEFDKERSPEETSERCVMTTWHAKDSLSEALWFFANCADPAESFEANYTDWLAISIANPTWTMEIRTCLFDGSTFGDAP